MQQITLSGKQVRDAWVIYTLHDSTGAFVFIGYSKFASLLTIQDAMKNPAFNIDELHTLTIRKECSTREEARDTIYHYMQNNHIPALNKTQHVNQYTKVKCDQTGQVWPTAAACAKELGINQGQLSQHLRRAKGYRTINAMTFSHVGFIDNVQAVSYPVVVNDEALK